MSAILAASFLLTASLAELKHEAARVLSLESHKDALMLAEELKNTGDPEAAYLAISAFAASSQTQQAIELIDKHSHSLKQTPFYKKSLESLALSVFKQHYHATQEPLKLAALAALAQEPDHRVLDLLLEAIDHPSLKIKMLALRGLSGFPDEKVKTALLFRMKLTNHPAVAGFVSKLFAHWQDKRIVPILEQKLTEDALSFEEKIGYILILKDLKKNIDADYLKQYASSTSAAKRLLAAYLLSSKDCPSNPDILYKLLKDHHIWVRQAACLAVIKKKEHTQAIKELIASFADDKSSELRKIYFYYGLLQQDRHCIDKFMCLFKTETVKEQKTLASLAYASGCDSDKLILDILPYARDPHTKLQLGLYLLSGSESKKGIELTLSALNELKDQKIYAISDPVLPLFTVEDEQHSQISMSAGQRRYKDKHFRLQLFHLLASKRHPEAKEVLKQLLKTDIFEVSLDAMVHFWQHFGYEDKEFLKQLLDENDADLRFKAALVLSYLDYDKSSRQELMKAYYKQPYYMQIQILFALSKYHESDVIDFYYNQLKSKYPMIQAVSAGCLFTALYK